MNKGLLVWLFGLVGLLFGCFAGAAEEITVLGLFTNKALVSIDGQRRLLRAGESESLGVRLIEANSREAVLEVDGERATYTLGDTRRLSTDFAKPRFRVAHISRDPSGSYLAVGSINRRTVKFLVDTGASWIAMNSNEARRLGVKYLEGKRSGVQTASGYTYGYAVKLDRVKVGEIELHNIEAMVIEGESPPLILLGMSFLRRVTLEDQGNVLTLKRKH